MYDILEHQIFCSMVGRRYSIPCGISHAITARSSREKKKLSGDFLRSHVVRNKRKNQADAANNRIEKPGNQIIHSPC